MQAKSFYQQTKFNLSCPKLAGSPNDIGYEVAFIGRSNAGKSSAINAITSQNKLAKVSKTPGRTQHLVYFNLPDNNRLVDLPGYGYAKVPLKIKQQLHKNINYYLANRSSLNGIILVMDIRHPLKQFDIQILDWCLYYDIAAHILLTKADKLSVGGAKNTEFKILNTFEKNNLISVQTFSALKKTNLEQVWGVLNSMLKIKF